MRRAIVFRRIVHQPRHREQRQPDVAHLDQQAVQRGLIDDRPAEHGLAVGLIGDRHFKPRRPQRVEVAFDTDLIAGLHGRGRAPAVAAWAIPCGPPSFHSAWCYRWLLWSGWVRGTLADRTTTSIAPKL